MICFYLRVRRTSCIILNPMRIAFITEHFYPYTGGISEHTFYLAQSLAREHDVLVFAPLYSGIRYVPLPERPLFRIIRTGKAAFFPANGSLTAFTYTPKTLFRLRDYLKTGFDVVHIQGSVVPTMPLFSAVLNTDAIKVVTYHAHHGKSIGYTFFKPVLQKALSMVHGHIAVSQAAKATIQRHFELENVHIIPNGVDIKRFTPYGEKVEKFADGKFNVLFVGRLEKRKGLKVLLESLKDVENEKIRLIIAGDGPLLKKYEGAAQNLKVDVVFVGKVSPLTLSALYRSADVLVAPSIKGESFGIVLLEAMASGVPVIASSITGYSETLKWGKYGLIFENGNPLDLKNKILYLYNNPDVRKRLSEKGLLYVRSEFSWDRIAERTLEFYMSLAPEKTRETEEFKVLGKP